MLLVGSSGVCSAPGIRAAVSLLAFMVMMPDPAEQGILQT